MLYDVIVVGSGPAACASSLAMAAKGLNVAQLVRMTGHKANAYGEHLAPSAKPHLKKLGVDVDDILSTASHRASSGIQSSWGGPEPYAIDYMFSPFGCGWNLDRSVFDECLMKAARRSGVAMVRFSHMRQIEEIADGWMLHLEAQSQVKEMTCRFLVDATGRNAAVARKLGYRPKKKDRLVGLYARLPGTLNSPGTLAIESCQMGWWYSLQLANGEHVAVFMTDTDFLPSGREFRAGFWRERLNESNLVRGRLGYVDVQPSIHVASACSQNLGVHASNRWLAVGDASIAFDPLAAVGLEKAFEDGLRAADHIYCALNKGGEITEEYTITQNSSYTKYLKQRDEYYGLEQRWPDEEFWKRR